jgi:hypothetical protein
MVMAVRPPPLPPPIGAIMFVIGFIIVTRKSNN